MNALGMQRLGLINQALGGYGNASAANSMAQGNIWGNAIGQGLGAIGGMMGNFGGSGGLAATSGQGAGSEITELTESAQALYAAAKWNRTRDYSDEDLKRASTYVDVSEDIKKILKDLPSLWRNSCILGAERLSQEFGGKKYTFHRQSTWVKKLEDHFKVLNRKSGKYFSNINKWSPADIWLVSDAGKRIDLLQTTSLVELNTKLKEALKSKDIIGVSLKQLVDKVKLSYVNYEIGRAHV